MRCLERWHLNGRELCKMSLKGEGGVLEITESHRAEHKPRATYQPDSHCEFGGKILSLYYYFSFLFFFFYFRHGFVAPHELQVFTAHGRAGAGVMRARWGAVLSPGLPAPPPSDSLLLHVARGQQQLPHSPLHPTQRGSYQPISPSGPWPAPLGPDPLSP